MKESEIFFLKPDSIVGKLVNPSLVISGSYEEAMVPITEADIADHILGIYAVRGRDAQAVGYAACKQILRTAPRALMGGVYLEPEYRGYGLATGMVSILTQKVFQNLPYITACTANCNTDSIPVFARLGYKPKGVEIDGKVKYELTKDAWRARSSAKPV